MSRMRGWYLILVGLIGLGVLDDGGPRVTGTAAEAARQQPRETFRSGVALLTIDASVRDAGGRPIADLTAADFTVRIDGEARSVVTARLFGGNPAAPPTAVAGFTRSLDLTPGRLVVVAIDRESLASGAEKAAFETAGRLLRELSPADAAGVVGIPSGGLELTRDHGAAADAVARMTGTAPIQDWRYRLSWEEVLAYERADRQTIDRVQERECQATSMTCAPELDRQAREMLMVGRAHMQTVATRMGTLFDSLAPLHAPKQIVLISGGLAFDVTLQPFYDDLARRAARAHVALFVVHLDQPSFDASQRNSGGTTSGREYMTGLANIASSTGGAFYTASGRAAGVFDAVLTDVRSFYQLAIESRPADADGKSHRVEVTVSRAGAHVRAPAALATSNNPDSGGDPLERALGEPVDVQDLPLQVATYVRHGPDPGTVRLTVAAELTGETQSAPRQLAFTISQGGKQMAGQRVTVDAGAGNSASTTVEIPPGEYRLRAGLVDETGRVGTLDIPLRAGLRTSAGVLLSDLLVGTYADGVLTPRSRLAQDHEGAALVELSSGESLAGVTGVLELIPAGSISPAARLPLALHTSERDTRVVLADTRISPAGLPPGSYVASALFTRDGTGFARVSRSIEIVPGETGHAPALVAGPAPAPAPAPALPARDPELAPILDKLGHYVAEYGNRASLIVGVEHYQQRSRDAPVGEPSARTLVAEIAVVKTADAAGWMGFRDVTAVDGKPVQDRQDRLEALFRGDAPDLSEARRIAAESARFNIGLVHRTFNEPTAPLFFFLPINQPRFAFSRQGKKTVGGVETWEIDFEEQGHPTMVRTTEGADVPSHGTVWIAADSGAVVRTRLVIRGYSGSSSVSTMEVTYANDQKLGVWLPARMTERHEGGWQRQRQIDITGTATYGSFKRFETAATIK
ncbi:MAG: VWA domain-containing protein [Acidobacteriota bacterium]